MGLLLGGLINCPAWSAAASSADLMLMSLEQQLDVKIVGASKYEQSQNEVAAAVSVITRQEIKTFGWRTLIEALSSLPGVYTTYDRQYNSFGLRGVGLPGDLTARVLININGNRVNDPVYDGGMSGREFPIDMNLIERIEFIPGPGGAVYGQNAMLGVVNVITRTGADIDGSEVTLSTQPAQRALEGRATWGRQLDNDVDVLISASGMQSRGDDRFFSYGSSGASGLALGMDGERDKEFFARMARGPWSAELVHGDRRKDDPTGSFFSDPLAPGQYNRDTLTLVQLKYQESFANDTLHWSGRLFMGRYRFGSTLSYQSQDVSFPAMGDWQGAELRLLSTGFADHKLMVGFEGQNNSRLYQATLNSSNPASDLVVHTTGYRIGVFAQDEWRLTDNLTATLGLRLDTNETTTRSTSPRAALIWQASPVTTMKALYGRSHRAPNSYERDYGDGLSQVANPALQNETVDTFEWVLDHQINRDLALRTSVYQWKTRDFIVLGIDPASGFPQYQSGEAITARGLELSANKTWEHGTRLRGSLSFQNAAYANGATLLNSPKLMGKLNLSGVLPWSGLRAGYELRYDSERLSLDGSHIPGYTVSNIHLTTDAVARGLELSLGIYNLFDKRYSHPGSETNWQNSLEQDGRTVRVQLDYRF